MVARGGIDPPTRGLSPAIPSKIPTYRLDEHASLRSTALPRQVHLAQERLEAGVVSHTLEERLSDDFDKRSIPLPIRPIEPGDGTFGVSQVCIILCDEIRTD